MKVTASTTHRSLLHHLDRNSVRLEELRLTAASGKRLERPSDDPAAVRPLLDARAGIAATERHLQTTGAALDRLRLTDRQLERAGNLLQRAREIAVAAGNGAYGAGERLNLATEVGDLRDQLLAAANTRMGGRHLFAGFDEGSPPFAVNPAFDPLLDPRPVLYGGDSGAVRLEIGPGEQVTVNAAGSAVFLGDADGDGVTDPGGTDLFAVLARLEQALRANDPAAATGRLGELDAGLDQLLGQRGRLGNTAQRLEGAQAHLEAVKVDLQGTLSRLEDADIVATLSRLSQQETAFEAALNVTAKISRLSILDFL